MVYNSAQCKMKRSLFFVIGVMIALVFASGCTKTVTQSSIHEITITFDNAAGNQLATKATNELSSYFSSRDAIIAYIYIGNSSGEEMWMPLPLLNGTESYEYAYTDNGIFAFTADAGDGYTWANNFSKKYRIIKIPNIAVVSKSVEELRESDYNTVVKELNLYEAPIIRK